MNVPFFRFLSKEIVRNLMREGEIMLRIILCEDDNEYRETLRKMISHVLFDKVEVSFECYKDGSELAKKLEKSEELVADFLFLDINMPELDGMSTAKILRKNQRDIKIVFVTLSDKYVFQGYEVHAYDYLLKPVSAERLEELFGRYFEEEKEDKKQCLVVSHRTKLERIPLKYVRYFLSDKRKIKAVLEKPYEAVEFYMKMSELEKRLKEASFLRCHQSYLVSLKRIKDWDGTGLVFVDGERIPVSKRYRNELKNVFAEKEK